MTGSSTLMLPLLLLPLVIAFRVSAPAPCPGMHELQSRLNKLKESVKVRCHKSNEMLHEGYIGHNTVWCRTGSSILCNEMYCYVHFIYIHKKKTFTRFTHFFLSDLIFFGGNILRFSFQIKTNSCFSHWFLDFA